jgi:hypothetical protein
MMNSHDIAHAFRTVSRASKLAGFNDNEVPMLARLIAEYTTLKRLEDAQMRFLEVPRASPLSLPHPHIEGFHSHAP